MSILLQCTLVAIGTKRHFAVVQQTVAIGGKADMAGRDQSVANDPFADMDGARLLQCTRLIQRGTKCCGNLCRHRRQCPQAGRWPLTVELKSGRGRPLGGGKLQRQRSLQSVRFFH